jgi:ASTRA-associated protein 1
MDVSALNFCAFALCVAASDGERGDAAGQAIVAVPNALDSGGIDFFHLPAERRVSVLNADARIKTGMVMALDLFHHPETGLLTVISGYEDGHTLVYRRGPVPSPGGKWKWENVLLSRPHSQPILSLDTSPSKDFYFTSSADAMIAKLPVPTSTLSGDPNTKPAKISNTKHAGQQDLTVRQDGKIFATAGWDARVRVYSTKTLKELAVLKWHQDGCYSIAFADNTRLDADETSSEAAKDQILVASKNCDSALEVIKHQRSIKAQMTHWLAAGGKDGKISLWDIF